MQRIALNFALTLIVACGSDDVGVAPGLSPMAGSYSVAWTCGEATCPAPSPLGSVNMATVTDRGTSTEIEWTGASVHTGERSGDCTTIPAGTDGGVARADYTICLGAPGLWGTPIWNGTAWLVELTAL